MSLGSFSRKWRLGAASAVAFAAALGATWPAAAADKDWGMRLELGPDVGFSRFSDGSVHDWGAQVYGAADFWRGPFGLMLHTRKGSAVSQIALTEAGLVPTMTYTSQVDIAPTFNLSPGPFRLQAGVGPWFAHSVERSDSVQDIQMSNFWTNWSELQLMGLTGRARVDLNLPILSPFAIVDLHSQRRLSIDSLDVDADTGEYQARELRLTGGVRLNVVPMFKVSLAAFAGEKSHVLGGSLLEGDEVREVGERSYGVALWAVLIIK